MWFIENKNGKFSFENYEIINKSHLLKNMVEDIGDIEIIPISNDYEADIIETYIKLIEDENNFDFNNINFSFLG